MSEYDRLERLVVEVYDKILDVAMMRYGPFTGPKVYIPRLNETNWQEQFLPLKDSAKFYGVVFYGPKPFFSVNSWALTREMEIFGEDYVRDKVLETLCHELVHRLKEGLSEVEVNIEGEKLRRLVKES